MNNLFVLFDSSCELCQHCKSWLQSQQQKVALTFIAAQSNEAQAIFPVLNHEETMEELTVISDTGAVYHGAKAWIMCLWALTDYRSWSYRLATPEMMHVAKRFVALISDNRKSLNFVLGQHG